MENTQLKETVGVSEWKVIEEDHVYKALIRYRPQSLFFHKFAEGSLKWSRKCPGIKTTLFCPSDSQWDGSVIIDVKGHVYAVAIFWPYHDYSYLISALETNDIVDWRHKPKILFGVPEDIFLPLEDSIRSLGIEIKNTYILHTYIMPANNAKVLDFDIPEDFTLSKLDLKHASQVNSAWPSARQESIKLVIDMININHTVGLFTNKDSKLVSWILQTYYGIGMMCTVQKYRRKGYGSVLAKALSKIIGESGNDVIAMVRDHNIPAHSLFKKLGFENLSLLKIIQTCSDTH